jgi:hypothetical protein
MTHIEIVNPLPTALAHYQAELVGVLRVVGAQVSIAATTSAELSGTDRQRARVLLGVLRHRVLGSPPPAGTHRLVIWPVLGYPELVLWRGPSARTSVLIHDPTPLRPQVGLGTVAVRATHALGRVRPLRGVIVHSDLALAAVRETGYDATVLPHPILQPRARQGGSSRRALVLGQHKDTRDIALLTALAPLLRAQRLEPAIVGRGWPEVPGWSVDSRFVSEREFRDQLGDSELVVLPYTKVYQSGVAVRAAEASVPVVGGRATNLTALFGADWPGLVGDGTREPGPGDWAAAVDRVLAAPRSAAAEPVRSYWKQTLAEWRSWVESL